MSTSISQFYEKVSTSEDLQQQLLVGAGGNPEAIYDSAVKLGASLGYQFSAEEAHTYCDTLDRLPDDLLDAIAAGFGEQSVYCVNNNKNT